MREKTGFQFASNFRLEEKIPVIFISPENLDGICVIYAIPTARKLQQPGSCAGFFHHAGAVIYAEISTQIRPNV